MPPTRILILTALASEARAVRKALYTGSREIEIRTIGVRGSVWDGVLPADSEWIVLAGMGGALSPHLAIGDLVIDTKEAFQWPDGFVAGRIECSDRVVADAHAKRALRMRSDAICVDMESDLVRRAAEAAHARLIQLRAISDTADDAIDPAVLNLVDPIGRPRPFAVASYLTRNPARIGDLRRLGRNASIALDRLGRGVAKLVQVLGMATLLMLFIIGCTANKAPDRLPATPPSLTTQPTAKTSVSEFNSERFGLRFTYPADWKPIESKDYALRLVREGTTYEFTLDIPELPPHIPGLIPLRLVVNGYTDDLKKSHPAMKIDSSETTTVAGAKAQRVACSWDENGIRTFDLAVLCVHGDRVFIFRAAGTTNQEEAATTLGELLGSVKWQ